MEHLNKNMTSSRDTSSESIWQRSLEARIPGTADINQDHQIYDTLIVGAGITGVTTALMLQKAGQRCLIVEARNIAFGTTGGTTAHLNTFFDATYPEIEHDFGTEAAKLVAQGGKEAISIVKGFVENLNIDCDFEYKTGWLYSQSEKESKELNDILESAQEAGVDVGVAAQNGVPIVCDQVIAFENQAQFHPLKYLQALVKEFKSLGGVLIEGNRIQKSSFNDGIHTAEAELGSFRARNLFYATHIPPGVNLLSFRCAPYRSYVLGARLRDDNYPEGLSYDMQEPYHYLRTHVIDGQKYLIVGGEDHKTGHGDPVKSFENLRDYTESYFNIESIDYQWSAQYYSSVDGLPYIGKLPGVTEDIYVATGFNGNGMTFGTLSAKVISDLILENESAYSGLFDPARMKPIAGFTEFVKENVDVAWRFVADRFSAEDMPSLQDLEPGQGMVTVYGDDQVAIYKDELGNITALNPVCTHAGCIVHFNDAEQSWDCPCHGGRYDLTGKVLTGPPTKNLESVPVNLPVTEIKP